MQEYNINVNLVRAIQHIYDKAISAIQMNGSTVVWAITGTIGRVTQGCFLLPTLFNIFLERVLSAAVEEHDGTVSIGGRNITILW